MPQPLLSSKNYDENYDDADYDDENYDNEYCDDENFDDANYDENLIKKIMRAMVTYRDGKDGDNGFDAVFVVDILEYDDEDGDDDVDDDDDWWWWYKCCPQ